jgi:flavin-dependent dehydrogenase
VRAAVIGSGPSGVAAATALIDNGWTVDMVDAGHGRPASCAGVADTLVNELDRRGRPSFATLTRLRSGDDPSLTEARSPGLRPTRTRKRILG